jgi:hypothetical protein
MKSSSAENIVLAVIVIMLAVLCFFLSGCNTAGSIVREQRIVYPDGAIETQRTVVKQPSRPEGESQVVFTTNGLCRAILGGSQSQAEINAATEEQRQAGKTQRLPIWIGAICILVGVGILFSPSHILGDWAGFTGIACGGVFTAAGIGFKPLENVLGVVWIAGAAIMGIVLLYVVVRIFIRKHC